MRNKALDQIRLIAAFLVIVIHSPFPGVIGNLVESLTRVAVPFFFMISGYYSCGKSREQIGRKIRRTGGLLIWSVTLYFLWSVSLSLYYGTTGQYLWEFFSLKTLFEAFVLNTGILLGHLWFVLALLYCYVIYAWLLNRVSGGVRLGISLLLLAMFFVVRETLKFSGVADTVYYIRNFLFVGLPFFLLGEWVAGKRKELDRVSAWDWAVIAAAGAVAAVTERFAVGCCDLYVGSVFTGVSIFILAQGGCGWTSERLCGWGSRYAGDIYVFHAMIITMFNAAGSVLGILHSPIFPVIRPFAVLAASLAAAALKEKILRLLANNMERTGVRL